MAIDDDRKHYPLPSGVQDAVLNRAQLAEAFGTSEPTIDRYRKDGMPVLAEGTNGQAYQFQLSDCYAWRQAREAERQASNEAAEAAVRQMRMELLGGDSGNSEMGLSARERKELYETESAYNRLARERGELIPQGEVIELLDTVLSMVRNSITGLPDRLSRDAALTGRQAEQAVVVTDDLLKELHTALAEFVDGNDATDGSLQTTLEAAE